MAATAFDWVRRRSKFCIRPVIPRDRPATVGRSGANRRYLFVFGCGRCDLRGGDPELMYQSLQHLSGRLPNHTIIRPGHNYGITPTTTMAEQLAGNPFLHFANVPGFVEYRMHLHDREEPYRPEPRPRRHPH
jgi:hydroxyacylglutathione hydrolase